MDVETPDTVKRDCYRHGELILIPVAEPPDGAQKDYSVVTLRPVQGKVLAYGEATGHTHRISAGEAEILERYELSWAGASPRLTGRLVRVETAVELDHEDHGHLRNVETGLEETVAPGLYHLGSAREWDYGKGLSDRVRD